MSVWPAWAVPRRIEPAVEALPCFVEPMLLEQDPPATPVEGEWAIEVKFDGTGRSCGGRGWWMVGAFSAGPRLQCTVSRAR